MYISNHSKKYFLVLSIIAMLCTGCAKKRQKIVLPPLKKHHFEQRKNKVTFKVRELNEQELRDINSEGLGSYKVGKIPLNKKSDEIESSGYVQVLYATLINESNQPITFRRKSISLPVLSPNNAYGFSNKNMILGFFWGAYGLLLTGVGISCLIINMSGYCVFTCGDYIIKVRNRDLSHLGEILLTMGGIEMALIGFTIGTQEAIRKSHLKNFARDTMLTDTYRRVLPEETFSWLMVINSDKYTQRFTVRCATALGSFIDFDVDIPSTEPF